MSTTVNAKLGAGIIVTEGNKSFKVSGVVLIDPTTGVPQVVSSQVSSMVATIATGTSISNDLDFGNTKLVRIVIPSAWTTADITFLTSIDGLTWDSLYDKEGVEYNVKAGASRSIIISRNDMLSIRYLRIRSGTLALPVNQVATRSLTLALIS